MLKLVSQSVLSLSLATPVSGSSSQTAPRMAGGQHGLLVNFPGFAKLMIGKHFSQSLDLGQA
jgi:hypothetical protein